MVRDFQSVIGEECLKQMPESIGRQPDAVVACVGGGSNAMGIFYPYIPHEQVVDWRGSGGEGYDSGKHSMSLQMGVPGVLHGNRTYLLQDENGQITETHSVSAGLTILAWAPEHAYLKDIGRAEYVGITDKEALEGFPPLVPYGRHHSCAGIVARRGHGMKLAATMRPDQHVLVNLSGRGDKDIGTVADLTGAEFYCRPSCRGLSVKGHEHEQSH